MTDEEIFKHLLRLGRTSKDPRGTVSACLIRHGIIVADSVSSDDGIRHAEDLLIEEVYRRNILDFQNFTLYTTLEPCSIRVLHKEVIDCTSLVIKNGIKRVIFGVSDRDQSTLTQKRLSNAGVTVSQIGNKEIIKACAELFNSSVQQDDVSLKSI